MMRGGGGGGRGRGRHRQEYSPRLEEKGGQIGSGRSNAPPSRHLWIGNLSTHMTQGLLFDQFVRFGDIESMAFIQGRSYAFVNFRREEDAVIASRTLQGIVLAGMPLKIEFQKGDKSSAFIDGDYEQTRGERHESLLIDRGESFPQKDVRLYSPESFKGNRSSEPSEVLWIGFPAFLDVDEMMLRRAFSPFGEIEKITAFPGRTYAFVRYRSVVAACRAKEALHGKLFNNPRVNICFARTDVSPSEHVREFGNPSLHQNLKPSVHLGPGRVGDISPLDGHFDGSGGKFHMPSSRFFSDMEHIPRDASIVEFGRKTRNHLAGDAPGVNAVGAFEGRGLQGLGSEGLYNRYRNSPFVDHGSLQHDLSVDRPRKGGHFDNSWDTENDAFPLAKKIRTDRYPEKEFSDYPFSAFDSEEVQAGPPKFFSDLADRQNEHFEPMAFGRGHLNQQNRSTNPPENDDFWRSDAGPGSLPANPSKLQLPTPEPHQASSKEWKWEGTIAKGGTPVCRARCFPVRKILDIMLPEFLDCTARTGLDMLSKHFYQAASSWVVFFVPETDADIAYYNEFMHYLGEKQRAAVAKLGEKTTLFLVPPSEFSEQVLKVPGKVSISGVILRFHQATSNFNALQHPLEAESSGLSYANRLTNQMNFQDNSSQAKLMLPDHVSSQGHNYLNSSSEHITSPRAFQASSRLPGAFSHSVPLPSPMVRRPSFIGENTYDDDPQHQNPRQYLNQSPHGFNVQNANVGSYSSENHMGQKYPPSKPIVTQGASSSLYTPGNLDDVKSHQNEIMHQAPLSTPVPSLRPEQLAHLTSLLEQQKRLGKVPASFSAEDHRQVNLSENDTYEAHMHAGDPSASKFSHVHQMQHYPSSVAKVHQTVNHEHHASQQAEPSTEEMESDPQKRLQATLKLAAVLLQQIQHQTKNE